MTNLINYVHKIKTSNSKYTIHLDVENLGFQLQKIELKYSLPFDIKDIDFCNTLMEVSVGGELVLSFENKAGETYQKPLKLLLTLIFSLKMNRLLVTL